MKPPKAENPRPSGQLLVKVIGANHLAAGDSFIFSRGSSDPFAVVYLQDQSTLQQTKPRRTRTARKTLNPRWKEDVVFWPQKHPEHLALHVDVFDMDEDKDEFLGTARLPFDRAMLKKLSHESQVFDLPLKSDPVRSAHSKIAATGSVQLEICWQPRFPEGTRGFMKALRVVVTSPHLIRVLGIALLGFAGLLLFVARDARWLCRGRTLAGCQQVDVPGAGVASLLAAFASLSAFAMHFAGTAGLFGARWSDLPPGLRDLEQQSGQRSAAGDESVGPSMQLQVQSAGVWQWKINLATACAGKAPITGLRLLTWLLHASALVLTLLAGALSWLEASSNVFIAEAGYLAAAAAANLVAGSGFLVVAGRLSAGGAPQVESWCDVEEFLEDGHHLGLGAGTGGSETPSRPREGSAGLEGGLERIAEKAQRKLKTWKVDVESLAQPLLNAKQQLQILQQQAEESLQAGAAAAAVPGAAPEWVQHLLDSIQHGASGSSGSHSVPVGPVSSAGVHSPSPRTPTTSLPSVPRMRRIVEPRVPHAATIQEAASAEHSDEDADGDDAATQELRRDPGAGSGSSGASSRQRPSPQREPMEDQPIADPEMEEGARASKYLLCCNYGRC